METGNNDDGTQAREFPGHRNGEQNETAHITMDSYTVDV